MLTLHATITPAVIFWLAYILLSLQGRTSFIGVVAILQSPARLPLLVLL